MGGRDKPHREVKKPKKGGKKDSISSIITPLPEVTVVKKVKKQKEEES